MAFFLGAGGVKRGTSDVWKPKRTVHDWGKSEYRIIRNWTPREQRERELPILHPLSSPPSSPLPPSPTVELPQNLTSSSHEPTPSIHQPSLSTEALLTHANDNEGLETNCVDEDAQVLCPLETKSALIAERSEHSVIVNEVQKDFNLISQQQVQRTRKGKSRTSKGKTKCSECSSVSMKLWEPKHTSRTARHFGELDSCVTVYDEMLREALDCTDNGVVETMLIDHWKYTQKHMLAVIRDVHTALTLEQLVRKEKAKHCVLQKELLSQLKAMRRANRKFQVAAEKAKQCKQVQGLQVP